MSDTDLCSCGFTRWMAKNLKRSHRMKHANLRNVRTLQRALLVRKGALPYRPVPA